MSIKAEEFLLEAESSMKCEDCSEVILRNAGSRSYYSLYHQALVKAENLGIAACPDSSSGVHEQLAIRFELHNHRAKVFATLLRRLKRNRNRCDYKLNDEVDKRFINQHLRSVKKALTDLDYLQ